MILSRQRVVALVRAAAIGLVLLAVPVSAFADTRLVRVIWDVGAQTIYVKPFERTDPGYGQFLVPKDAAAAAADGFVKTTVERVLRKGDHVRVYLVNFNPVAHSVHESSAAAVVLKDPNLAGPIISGAIMAITGGKPFSKNAPAPFSVVLTTPRDPCGLTELDARLDRLRDAAIQLQKDAVAFIDRVMASDLNADANKLARVPTAEKMRNEFDNQKAWGLVATEPDVFGGNFKTRYQALVTAATTLADGPIKAANDALRAFDAEAVARTPFVCQPEAKALIEGRDLIASFITQLTGTESPIERINEKLDAGNKLWAAYERKLAAPNWTAEANELVVKDAVEAESVVRVDAVFVSPEKTVTERAHRSVVIGVEPYRPALAIASGIGFNWFNFKQLAGVKVTRTAADGTVSVKDEIRIVDDPTWEPIIPVWTEHIRVAKYRDVGLYATVGTTPDRNIFKNLILGGSVLFPAARLVVTAGAIGARGYKESDLEPIRKAFSNPDGIALEGVDVAKLNLPSKPWHYSFYAAATFVLVSF